MMNRICVLSLLLMGGIGWGQESDAAARMEQLTSLPLEADARDYQLGTGDLIRITVFGVEELDQVVRIGSNGQITLPLVGKVIAEGMTAPDLEARITEVLLERKLVRDPQVTVFTEEYRSQPVYVLGAVNRPGQYMVTNQLRLLDALTMAGGLDTKRASNYLIVQRSRVPAADQNGQLRERREKRTALGTKINLDALLNEGDLSLNLELRAGDVVQVPEREEDKFYVVGDVTRPGAFPFEVGRDVSVLSALSFAGGFGQTAKPSKARILRDIPGENTRKHISIDINKIMLGKAEDVELKPEDVLVIPTSNGKVFQKYVLPAAVAAGVGALVWAGFAR